MSAKRKRAEGGVDAIRRRSEAWVVSRAKMRAKIEQSGGLRYRDSEGGAPTQAHRDRVELLLELDGRDVVIAELRQQIGWRRSQSGSHVALDAPTEQALLLVLTSNTRRLAHRTGEGVGAAAAAVLALTHLLTGASRRSLHATALDAAAIAFNKAPLVELARHLQETTA